MSLPIGTLGRCKADYVPSVRSSITVNRFEERDRLLHTVVEDLKILSSKPGHSEARRAGHYYWHQDYSCSDDLSCGPRRGRNKTQEGQERRHRQKVAFAHGFPFSNLLWQKARSAVAVVRFSPATQEALSASNNPPYVSGPDRSDVDCEPKALKQPVPLAPAPSSPSGTRDAPVPSMIRQRRHRQLR
jgi:hypothetical protein